MSADLSVNGEDVDGRHFKGAAVAQFTVVQSRFRSCRFDDVRFRPAISGP